MYNLKFDNDIIADYFAYRLSTFPKLKKLCEDSPDFAMAHIFKGYLLTSMGTQGTRPAATKAADRAADCPEGLTENEKGHLKALRAWIEGNSTDACNHWDDIIIDDPQDLLAIKLQHFSLFWLGIAPIGGNFILNFQEIGAGPFVPGFCHGKGIAREDGLKIGSSGCSDRCYLVFVSIDVSRVEVGRPLKSTGIDFLFFEFLAHCFLGKLRIPVEPTNWES